MTIEALPRDHGNLALRQRRFGIGLFVFGGFGAKIINIVVKRRAMLFKVPFPDDSIIDIDPSIYVQRVFGRLRAAVPMATFEELITQTWRHYPSFSGLLDDPVGKLGREVCRAQMPACKRRSHVEQCGCLDALAAVARHCNRRSYRNRQLAGEGTSTPDVCLGHTGRHDDGTEQG